MILLRSAEFGKIRKLFMFFHGNSVTSFRTIYDWDFQIPFIFFFPSSTFGVSNISARRKGARMAAFFKKDSGCCRKFDGCLHLVRRGDMSENAEVLARF